MAPLWAHQRDSDIEVLTYSVPRLIIILITIIIMVTRCISTMRDFVSNDYGGNLLVTNATVLAPINTQVY